MLVDSHVHLGMKEFRGDLEAVLERAKRAGVEEMLEICYDAKSIERTLDLAERHESIFGTAGIHPHEARYWNSQVERAIKEALKHPRILAVGEIGLDFYRDLSPRDVQREVFRRQIAIALQAKKPIIIHSREAFEEVLSILREKGVDDVGGIFHAFPGTPEQASQALSLGFIIGVGGPVTYRKSRTADTAMRLPSYGFVLETDCPYLPPEPYRGKRNEPAYVAIVRDKLAELRGVDSEDIERATSFNYRRLLRGEALPEPSIAYFMKGNVYINTTSHCTNSCRYCMRFAREPMLYGYNLRLASEPSVREMVDAAAKIAALANVLMDAGVTPRVVDRRGIREITAEDLASAKRGGRKVKLVATARQVGGGVALRVAPEEVGPESPFWSVDGTSSALTIRTDLMGDLTIVEGNPTVDQTDYAIFSDMLLILESIRSGSL